MLLYKGDYLKVFFVFFTIVASINFWSFKLITDNVIKYSEAIILIILISVVAYNFNIFKKKLFYTSHVFLFLLFPIASAFAANIYHDQPFHLSFLILRVIIFWLFYHVLHVFDLSEDVIIKIIVTVGIIWGFITIVQQFTYPTFYFYNREDSEDGYYQIYRAGVYRFMIYGHQYGAFVLIYFFYKFLIKSNFKYFTLFLYGLICLYFYGTRQYIISAGFCMLVPFFITKGKARLNVLILISLAIVILAFSADYIINQYIELTKEQWQYGEDQRMITAKFFLFEFWPHWVTMIIGNGPAHLNSDYGFIIYLLQKQHIYRVDVGIIGAFNEFGILHVLNILWLNIKSLKNRTFTIENKYLLLIFIYGFILLITSEYYMSKTGIPFYCLIFYLVDKNIQKRKIQF